MNKYKQARLKLLITAMLATPAWCAESNDWKNLQSLQRGDRVGVVHANLKRVEGRFENVDGSVIQIEAGGVRSIRRQDVIRVYRIGTSRKMRMLIGAASGFAAGSAIAAGVGKGSSGEGIFSAGAGGAATIGAVAGSAGLGAAVGGLTGGGYKTIYQKGR